MALGSSTQYKLRTKNGFNTVATDELRGSKIDNIGDCVVFPEFTEKVRAGSNAYNVNYSVIKLARGYEDREK